MRLARLVLTLWLCAAVPVTGMAALKADGCPAMAAQMAEAAMNGAAGMDHSMHGMDHSMPGMDQAMADQTVSAHAGKGTDCKCGCSCAFAHCASSAAGVVAEASLDSVLPDVAGTARGYEHPAATATAYHLALLRPPSLI